MSRTNHWKWKRSVYSLVVLYLFIASIFAYPVMANCEKEPTTDECLDQMVENGDVSALKSSEDISKAVKKNPNVAQHLSKSQVNSIKDEQALKTVIKTDSSKVGMLSEKNVKRFDWTSDDLRGLKPKLNSKQIGAILEENPEKIGDLGELNPLAAIKALKEKYGLKDVQMGGLPNGVYLVNDHLKNKKYCRHNNIPEEECMGVNLKSGSKFSMITPVSKNKKKGTKYPGFVVCKKKGCNVIAGKKGAINIEGDKVTITYKDGSVITLKGSTGVRSLEKYIEIDDQGNIELRGVDIKAYGTEAKTKIIMRKNGFDIIGPAKYSYDKIRGTSYGGKTRFTFNGDNIAGIRGEQAEIYYHNHLFKANTGFVKLNFGNNKLESYRLKGGRTVFKGEEGKTYTTIVPEGEEVFMQNNANRLRKVRQYQNQIATLQKNCNENKGKCKEARQKIREMNKELDNLLGKGQGFFDMDGKGVSGFQTIKSGGGVEYRGENKKGETEFTIKGKADNTVFSYFEPKKSKKRQKNLNGIVYFSNSKSSPGELGTAEVKYDLEKQDGTKGSASLKLRFNKKNGATNAQVKVSDLTKNFDILNSVVTNEPNIGVAFLSDKPGKMMYFGTDREGLYATNGAQKGTGVTVTKDLKQKIQKLKLESDYLQGILKQNKEDIVVSDLSREEVTEYLSGDKLSDMDKEVLDAMKEFRFGDSEKAIDRIERLFANEDNLNEKSKALSALADFYQQNGKDQKIKQKYNEMIDVINRQIKKSSNKKQIKALKRNKKFFKRAKASKYCQGKSKYEDCINSINDLSSKTREELISQHEKALRVQRLQDEYDTAGTPEAREKIAKRIAKENPHLGQTLLATTYQKQGKLEKAEKASKLAQEHYISNVENKEFKTDMDNYFGTMQNLLSMQASIDMKKEEYSSARRNAENLLIYDKSNIQAQKILGNSLVKQGKLDKSIESWEKFKENNEDDTALTEKANKALNPLYESKANQLFSENKIEDAYEYAKKIEGESELKDKILQTVNLLKEDGTYEKTLSRAEKYNKYRKELDKLVTKENPTEAERARIEELRKKVNKQSWQIHVNKVYAKKHQGIEFTEQEKKSLDEMNDYINYRNQKHFAQTVNSNKFENVNKQIDKIQNKLKNAEGPKEREELLKEYDNLISKRDNMLEKAVATARNEEGYYVGELQEDAEKMFGQQKDLNKFYNSNKVRNLLSQGKKGELNKFLKNKDKDLKYSAIASALSSGKKEVAKDLIESEGGYEQLANDKEFSNKFEKEFTAEQLKQAIRERKVSPEKRKKEGSSGASDPLALLKQKRRNLEKAKKNLDKKEYNEVLQAGGGVHTKENLENTEDAKKNLERAKREYNRAKREELVRYASSMDKEEVQKEVKNTKDKIEALKKEDTEEAKKDLKLHKDYLNVLEQVNKVKEADSLEAKSELIAQNLHKAEKQKEEINFVEGMFGFGDKAKQEEMEQSNVYLENAVRNELRKQAEENPERVEEFLKNYEPGEDRMVEELQDVQERRKELQKKIGKAVVGTKPKEGKSLEELRKEMKSLNKRESELENNLQKTRDENRFSELAHEALKFNEYKQEANAMYAELKVHNDRLEQVNEKIANAESVNNKERVAELREEKAKIQGQMQAIDSSITDEYKNSLEGEEKELVELSQIETHLKLLQEEKKRADAQEMQYLDFASNPQNVVNIGLETSAKGIASYFNDDWGIAGMVKEKDKTDQKINERMRTQRFILNMCKDTELTPEDFSKGLSRNEIKEKLENSDEKAVKYVHKYMQKTQENKALDRSESPSYDEDNLEEFSPSMVDEFFNVRTTAVMAATSGAIAAGTRAIGGGISAANRASAARAAVSGTRKAAATEKVTRNTLKGAEKFSSSNFNPFAVTNRLESVTTRALSKTRVGQKLASVQSKTGRFAIEKGKGITRHYTFEIGVEEAALPRMARSVSGGQADDVLDGLESLTGMGRRGSPNLGSLTLQTDTGRQNIYTASSPEHIPSDSTSVTIEKGNRQVQGYQDNEGNIYVQEDINDMSGKSVKVSDSQAELSGKVRNTKDVLAEDIKKSLPKNPDLKKNLKQKYGVTSLADIELQELFTNPAKLSRATEKGQIKEMADETLRDVQENDAHTSLQKLKRVGLVDENGQSKIDSPTFNEYVEKAKTWSVSKHAQQKAKKEVLLDLIEKEDDSALLATLSSEEFSVVAKHDDRTEIEEFKQSLKAQLKSEKQELEESEKEVLSMAPEQVDTHNKLYETYKKAFETETQGKIEYADKNANGEKFSIEDIKDKSKEEITAFAQNAEKHAQEKLQQPDSTTTAEPSFSFEETLSLTRADMNKKGFDKKTLNAHAENLGVEFEATNFQQQKNELMDAIQKANEKISEVTQEQSETTEQQDRINAQEERTVPTNEEVADGKTQKKTVNEEVIKELDNAGEGTTQEEIVQDSQIAEEIQEELPSKTYTNDLQEIQEIINKVSEEKAAKLKEIIQHAQSNDKKADNYPIIKNGQLYFKYTAGTRWENPILIDSEGIPWITKEFNQDEYVDTLFGRAMHKEFGIESPRADKTTYNGKEYMMTEYMPNTDSVIGKEEQLTKDSLSDTFIPTVLYATYLRGGDIASPEIVKNSPEKVTTSLDINHGHYLVDDSGNLVVIDYGERFPLPLDTNRQHLSSRGVINPEKGPEQFNDDIEFFKNNVRPRLESIIRNSVGNELSGKELEEYIQQKEQIAQNIEDYVNAYFAKAKKRDTGTTTKGQKLFKINGKEFSQSKLRNGVTIGRLPSNDITINDEAVSREHARLKLEGDKLVLEDLKSTNGIIVGEKKYNNKKFTIQPDSEIQLGQTQLQIEKIPVEPKLQVQEKLENLDTLRKENGGTPAYQLSEAVIEQYGGKGTASEYLSLKHGYKTLPGQNWLYSPKKVPKSDPWFSVEDGKATYKLHMSVAEKHYDLFLYKMTEALRNNGLLHKISPGPEYVKNTVQHGKTITVYGDPSSQKHTIQAFQNVIEIAKTLHENYGVQGVPLEELQEKDANLQYELPVPGTGNLVYYTIEKFDNGKNKQTIPYVQRDEKMHKYWGSGPLDNVYWENNPFEKDHYKNSQIAEQIQKEAKSNPEVTMPAGADVMTTETSLTNLIQEHFISEDIQDSYEVSNDIANLILSSSTNENNIDEKLDTLMQERELQEDDFKRHPVSLTGFYKNIQDSLSDPGFLNRLRSGEYSETLSELRNYWEGFSDEATKGQVYAMASSASQSAGVPELSKIKESLTIYYGKTIFPNYDSETGRKLTPEESVLEGLRTIVNNNMYKQRLTNINIIGKVEEGSKITIFSNDLKVSGNVKNLKKEGDKPKRYEIEDQEGNKYFVLHSDIGNIHRVSISRNGENIMQDMRVGSDNYLKYLRKLQNTKIDLNEQQLIEVAKELSVNQYLNSEHISQELNKFSYLDSTSVEKIVSVLKEATTKNRDSVMQLLPPVMQGLSYMEFKSFVDNIQRAEMDSSFYDDAYNELKNSEEVMEFLEDNQISDKKEACEKIISLVKNNPGPKGQQMEIIYDLTREGRVEEWFNNPSLENRLGIIEEVYSQKEELNSYLIEGTKIHYKNRYNVDLVIKRGDGTFTEGKHTLKEIPESKQEKVIELAKEIENKVFTNIHPEIIRRNGRFNSLVIIDKIVDSNTLAFYTKEGDIFVPLQSQQQKTEHFIDEHHLHSVSHEFAHSFNNDLQDIFAGADIEEGVINEHFLMKFIEKHPKYSDYVPDIVYDTNAMNYAYNNLLMKMYQDRVKRIAKADLLGEPEIDIPDDQTISKVFPTKYSYLGDQAHATSRAPLEFFAEWFAFATLNPEKASNFDQEMYDLIAFSVGDNNPELLKYVKDSGSATAGLNQDQIDAYDADNPQAAIQTAEEIQQEVTEKVNELDFGANNFEANLQALKKAFEAEGVSVEETKLEQPTQVENTDSGWLIKIDKAKLQETLQNADNKDLEWKKTFAHELAEIRAKQTNSELTKKDTHLAAMQVEQEIERGNEGQDSTTGTDIQTKEEAEPDKLTHQKYEYGVVHPEEANLNDFLTHRISQWNIRAVDIKRISSIANELSKNEKPTIVEIGSGNSFASYLLAKEGAKVIAIDPNRELVESAAKEYGMKKVSEKVWKLENPDLTLVVGDADSASQILRELGINVPEYNDENLMRLQREQQEIATELSSRIRKLVQDKEKLKEMMYDDEGEPIEQMSFENGDIKMVPLVELVDDVEIDLQQDYGPLDAQHYIIEQMFEHISESPQFSEFREKYERLREIDKEIENIKSKNPKNSEIDLVFNSWMPLNFDFTRQIRDIGASSIVYGRSVEATGISYGENRRLLHPVYLDNLILERSYSPGGAYEEVSEWQGEGAISEMDNKIAPTEEIIGDYVARNYFEVQLRKDQNQHASQIEELTNKKVDSEEKYKWEEELSERNPDYNPDGYKDASVVEQTLEEAETQGLSQDQIDAYDADNPQAAIKTAEEIQQEVTEKVNELDFGANNFEANLQALKKAFEAEGVSVEEKKLEQPTQVENTDSGWLIKIDKAKLQETLQNADNKELEWKKTFAHELAEIRAKQTNSELTKKDTHLAAMQIEQEIEESVQQSPELQKEIDKLIKQLGKKKSENAKERLAEIGEPAIPKLIEATEANRFFFFAANNKRSDAIDTLGRLDYSQISKDSSYEVLKKLANIPFTDAERGKTALASLKSILDARRHSFTEEELNPIVSNLLQATDKSYLQENSLKTLNELLSNYKISSESTKSITQKVLEIKDTESLSSGAEIELINLMGELDYTHLNTKTTTEAVDYLIQNLENSEEIDAVVSSLAKIPIDRINSERQNEIVHKITENTDAEVGFTEDSIKILKSLDYSKINKDNNNKIISLSLEQLQDITLNEEDYLEILNKLDYSKVESKYIYEVVIHITNQDLYGQKLNLALSIFDKSLDYSVGTIEERNQIVKGLNKLYDDINENIGVKIIKLYSKVLKQGGVSEESIEQILLDTIILEKKHYDDKIDISVTKSPADVKNEAIANIFNLLGKRAPQKVIELFGNPDLYKEQTTERFTKKHRDIMATAFVQGLKNNPEYSQDFLNTLFNIYGYSYDLNKEERNLLINTLKDYPEAAGNVIIAAPLLPYLKDGVKIREVNYYIEDFLGLMENDLHFRIPGYSHKYVTALKNQLINENAFEEGYEYTGKRIFSKEKISSIQTLEDYVQLIKEESSNILSTTVTKDAKSIQEAIFSSEYLVGRLILEGRTGDSVDSVMVEAEELGDAQDNIPTRFVHFNNQGEQTMYVDGSEVAFMYPVEYLLENHAYQTDPLNAPTDWGVGGFSDAIHDESNNILIDHAIVLLPKSQKESYYEPVFERLGKRPKFVYYYEANNVEQGIQEFRNKFGIGEQGPIRISEKPKVLDVDTSEEFKQDSIGSKESVVFGTVEPEKAEEIVYRDEESLERFDEVEQTSETLEDTIEEIIKEQNYLGYNPGELDSNGEFKVYDTGSSTRGTYTEGDKVHKYPADMDLKVYLATESGNPEPIDETKLEELHNSFVNKIKQREDGSGMFSNVFKNYEVEANEIKPFSEMGPGVYNLVTRIYDPAKPHTDLMTIDLMVFNNPEMRDAIEYAEAFNKQIDTLTKNLNPAEKQKAKDHIQVEIRTLKRLLKNERIYKSKDGGLLGIGTEQIMLQLMRSSDHDWVLRPAESLEEIQNSINVENVMKKIIDASFDENYNYLGTQATLENLDIVRPASLKGRVLITSGMEEKSVQELTILAIDYMEHVYEDDEILPKLREKSIEGSSSQVNIEDNDNNVAAWLGTREVMNQEDLQNANQYAETIDEQQVLQKVKDTAKDIDNINGLEIDGATVQVVENLKEPSALESVDGDWIIKIDKARLQEIKRIESPDKALDILLTHELLEKRLRENNEGISTKDSHNSAFLMEQDLFFENSEYKDVYDSLVEMDEKQTSGSEETTVNPEFQVSSTGALLSLQYPGQLQEFTLNGHTYTPKDEFHVTLVGFKHKLPDLIKSKTEVSKKEAKKQAKEIMSEAGEGIEFKVTRTGEYRLVQKTDPETGETISTVIELVEVQGRDEYYDALERKLTEQLGEEVKVSRSPAHITLFTDESGKAIGLTTEEDMESMARELNSEEMEAIKQGTLQSDKQNKASENIETQDEMIKSLLSSKLTEEEYSQLENNPQAMEEVVDFIKTEEEGAVLSERVNGIIDTEKLKDIKSRIQELSSESSQIASSVGRETAQEYSSRNNDVIERRLKDIEDKIQNHEAVYEVLSQHYAGEINSDDAIKKLTDLGVEKKLAVLSVGRSFNLARHFQGIDNSLEERIDIEKGFFESFREKYRDTQLERHTERSVWIVEQLKPVLTDREKIKEIITQNNLHHEYGISEESLDDFIEENLLLTQDDVNELEKLIAVHDVGKLGPMRIKEEYNADIVDVFKVNGKDDEPAIKVLSNHFGVDKEQLQPIFNSNNLDPEMQYGEFKERINREALNDFLLKRFDIFYQQYKETNNEHTLEEILDHELEQKVLKTFQMDNAAKKKTIGQVFNENLDMTESEIEDMIEKLPVEGNQILEGDGNNYKPYFSNHGNWGKTRLRVAYKQGKVTKDVINHAAEHHFLNSKEPKLGLITFIDFLEANTGRKNTNEVGSLNDFQKAMEILNSQMSDKIENIRDEDVKRSYKIYMEILENSLAKFASD